MMLTATDSVITAGRDCATRLTAKLAPWMTSLVQQPEVARTWLRNFNSPLHVTVASEFERNAKDLLAPLKSRGIQGGLYFARKANKLSWFVTAAKNCGIGVDVASYDELHETLQLGVSPSQIVVTAIGKDDAIITESIKNGCLLVIDNADELDAIQQIATGLGQKTRVGLRVSGFKVGTREVFSRFGIPVGEFNSVLENIDSKGLLQLENLHAHLDRYDTEERATAGFYLLELIDYAASQGHKITSIDLGGGILIRYLDNADEFKEFTETLVKSVRGEKPTMTFRGDGLGFYRVGDSVEGNADLYPAWNALSKERFISQVLEHSNQNGSLHRQLTNRGIKLFFEPGRALLDNSGVTLGKITFRKRDTLGNLLVGVSMNRMNLRPFRAEFCSDPLFLDAQDRPAITEGAFIVGNLCSESDLIFRRKIALGHMPEPNDTIMFANSAGYMAHHMEIGTHGNPLPQNILVDAKTLDIIRTI